MSSKRFYVDIHVLQTLPPSCVNRDDTGSPKTALYGGVTRARVSSQAWKRAVREAFTGKIEQGRALPDDWCAKRTLRLAALVHKEVVALAPELSIDLAEALIKVLGLKSKRNKENEQLVEAMFFIGNLQARQLAAIVVENREALERLLPYLDGMVGEEDENKDEEESGKARNRKRKAKLPKDLAATKDTIIESAKVAIASNQAVDIALFGRMVATSPKLNIDAAAQVAHAISTHKVNNEFDYFTAVDDLAPEDNVGAAHIGIVEFNSSTLYRYATLAQHLLKKHLGDDSAEAAVGFVRAFLTSMPTGKQNTFANRTLPDVVLVAVRTDQPINLVGAFEKPVLAGEEGYVTRSAKRLKEHALRVYQDFAGAPAHAFVVGEGLEDLGERLPLEQMLNELHKAIVSLEESQ